MEKEKIQVVQRRGKKYLVEEIPGGIKLGELTEEQFQKLKDNADNIGRRGGGQVM